MHGVGGVQEEKGFLRMALRVLPKKLPALFEKDQIHVFEAKIGDEQAGAVVEGIRVLGEGGFVEGPGGRDRDPIAVEVGVEGIRGRAAGREHPSRHECESEFHGALVA